MCSENSSHSRDCNAIKDRSNILQSQQKKSGLIFDIQKFALNDGPGIRTLVLMKGCPLRCEWCGNPESQKTCPEIIYYSEKCLNCNRCIDVCNHKEAAESGLPNNDKYCIGCGKCADACYPQARQLVGKWIDKEGLLEIVKKDRAFYLQSNGGVTIGGGEPTMQSRFLSDFLKECKAISINTAIETCGYSSWKKMKSVLDYTDLLLFDIKHIDSEKHKKYTGVENELIIRNAIKAVDYVNEMIVRLPLIPGFNDSYEDLNLIGEFVRQKLPGIKRVDILPYHSVGESKSMRLGREYGLKGLRTLAKEEVCKSKEILEAYTFDVKVIN